MSDYNQLDKRALDRYITRDDDRPEDDSKTWVITIRINDVNFSSGGEYYGDDVMPQVGLAISDADLKDIGEEGEIVITYKRVDAGSTRRTK